MTGRATSSRLTVAEENNQLLNCSLNLNGFLDQPLKLAGSAKYVYA